MNKPIAVAFMTALLIGCGSSSGNRSEARVHEVTPYHHQLVSGGAVALEGYIYEVEKRGGETYVFASAGKPKDCGGGDKFVLDPNISAWVIRNGRLEKSDTTQAQSLDQAFAAAQGERDAIRRRLPMLFSSEGCS